MLMLVITGCSDTNYVETDTESISSGTYSAYLFLDGEEKQWVGGNGEEFNVKPGKLVGTVITKFPLEIAPKKEFTSNYLEKGTEIYSVEREPNIFLAKKRTEYMKFTDSF